MPTRSPRSIKPPLFCRYPADPFNIYMPATWPGKLLAISASGWGLMLTALLIESVAAHMQLSRYECTRP